MENTTLKDLLAMKFLCKECKIWMKNGRTTKTKIIFHFCCCYFMYSEKQFLTPRLRSFRKNMAFLQEHAFKYVSKWRYISNIYVWNNWTSKNWALKPVFCSLLYPAQSALVLLTLDPLGSGRWGCLLKSCRCCCWSWCFAGYQKLCGFFLVWLHSEFFPPKVYVRGEREWLLRVREREGNWKSPFPIFGNGKGIEKAHSRNSGTGKE